MTLFIQFNIFNLMFFTSTAFAQNWMNSKKYPKGCQATYYLNAKVVERRSSSRIKISQNSIGFSGMGFIELTSSSDKENLPIFGQDFLDIFVKKLKQKMDTIIGKNVQRKQKNKPRYS